MVKPVCHLISKFSYTYQKSKYPSPCGDELRYEELRDILIAISVIAKRLATKMENAVRSGTQKSKANTSQGG